MKSVPRRGLWFTFFSALLILTPVKPQPVFIMPPCDPVLSDVALLQGGRTSKEILETCYGFTKEDLARFQGEVKKALEDSGKKGDPLIIIDKAAFQLNLIKGGKRAAKYNIELGFNPFDDKTIQGDGCTPEGLYKVESKKEGDGTKYYKALLINYPNENDVKEFKQMKKKGLIPKSAEIGGLIEIHGKGTGTAGNNGGVNWTLGCVALSTGDITQLYDQVAVGTPVLVVRYGANKISYLTDMPEMTYSLD